MSGHQRIKNRGLIWITDHQTVLQFQQRGSQYPFLHHMTFFRYLIQELIMVINSKSFLVNIYSLFFFLWFLFFKPDRYLLFFHPWKLFCFADAWVYIGGFLDVLVGGGGAHCFLSRGLIRTAQLFCFFLQNVIEIGLCGCLMKYPMSFALLVLFFSPHFTLEFINKKISRTQAKST